MSAGACSIAEIVPRSPPLRQIESMLARAFAQDAHFDWLVRPDGARDEAMRRLFRLLLAPSVASPPRVFATADLRGAAIWFAAGHWPLPMLDQAGFLVRYLPIAGWSRALGRAIDLKRSDARHPRTPHCYLQVIGVDEEYRGRGYGAALLRGMLAECDARRWPAYLETANERNVPFYARFGFVNSGSTALGRGLRLLSLVREPTR